ncbi:E3 SUMO-protein ligase RanBP2 [Eumeta japonica]|uniref:E3 SUMO-protein ligase RanBP2 n=1 Tax=Eumeta variegata TaxID=151549 RepID=A0A4C1X9V6_EUMVA|nr:E3 SUMO-protein ligase RanBP2 [Eumeta japonica]
MYRSKKDVDKHVESLTSRLSAKEFQLRTYSIARLYYEVEDYASCQRYVEQYITEKSNSAAAYKLLGQALQKLGQKERALEQYKSSLDIDPTQSSLVLDICAILVDKDVTFDTGRAKYWCEKAEATFPKHPVTFQLREKLMVMVNPDPEAIIQLLKSELAVHPKDVTLHARLLKHYSQTNRHNEAFEHSFEYEFDNKNFTNNYAWYETLGQILKYYTDDKTDWKYQLLLLTVKEKLCALSLTEIPSGASKGFVESNNLLHDYDQTLSFVAKLGASPGCADFYTALIDHHRSQFVFHLATFLLRKAKKNLLNWREANSMAAPLMLTAWHTIPIDIKARWLICAPIKQQKAVERWNLEGSYRLSQAGHYLLSNNQDKSHSFIDQLTLNCSGTNWRDKMYEEIFTNIDHLSKKNSSDFVSNSSNNLAFELPRKTVVQSYDIDAQRLYPNSLHHFVWMLLNYKNYAHFKCSVFDMLTPKSQNIHNCGPDSLNKYDIFSFLLCTTFTVQQNRVSPALRFRDEPIVLPANITDLLCTTAQMKWWDCAYKLSQNELGKEFTDIRTTLSRGLEVVRCIDNHGLDPELLCLLGRTFNEKAKSSDILEEKTYLEMRAKSYYSNAIPLLERLKNKMSLQFPVKRMFEYLHHKELSFQQILKLIEESKTFVGLSYLNENDYEKAVELLSGVKSAQAFFYLGQIFKLMALDMSENMISDQRSKYLFLLNKAKLYASKSLESFKDFEIDSQTDLHSDSRELLESIETLLSRISNDTRNININDVDVRYFSDENISSGGSDQMHSTLRNSNSYAFRNSSSTPKRRDVNSTVYKSAAESQVFENTKIDSKLLERIDLTVNNFMEQTKMWIDENRNLGNQIMNSVNSNTQSTSDQIKLLKLSIDHIKEQIGACRDECKDVGELKRQVAELKNEVIKLKKLSPEQTVNNENEYLNENYKSNDPTAAFTGSLPFTPPVLPTFNPRIMPPIPIPQALYGLYGQNLYNFYAQCPQFAQPGSVPGTSQICDPSRSVNYQGV